MKLSDQAVSKIAHDVCKPANVRILGAMVDWDFSLN